MAKQRALIIGGSVGGLFAANLLRSIGWDAVVFERNPDELTGRGAGISTHPQLHDITKRLGIPFDDTMGIRIDTVIFLDHDGRDYDRRADRAADELVGPRVPLAARPGARPAATASA